MPHHSTPPLHLSDPPHSESAFIDTLRAQLEQVLHSLANEKQQLEYSFQIELARLKTEVSARDAVISGLERALHQSQQENGQIRYQYSQRVAMMTILKKQNALISKEFSEERKQMAEALRFLESENQRLKHALLQRHFPDTPLWNSNPYQLPLPALPRTPATPRKLHTAHYSSMKDLDAGVGGQARLRQRATEMAPRYSESRQSILRESDESVGESSLCGRMQEGLGFKESRITQVKERRKYGEGLDKMSTKTQLSRQRTEGGKRLF